MKKRSFPFLRPLPWWGAGLLLTLAACGGGSGDTDTTGSGSGSGGSTSTTGVRCGISGSELNSDESVRLTATYSWTCSTTARVLSANGVPNHEVGTFPNAGNPNTIGAVSVSATYTLAPAVTGTATNVQTPGHALNGVKLEPGTAGTCNDAGNNCDIARGGTGSWRIEALGQTAFDFGTDENNAHVQPTGQYHYHGMPEKYLTRLGAGSAMTLVGWATDGFPIYARLGHSTAGSAASALKVLKSSYRVKSTPDTGRPATSLYAMGTFTQDHEYVAGLGDLDECNGRTGVTPEFPSGIYHYVITDTYPFINRCVKGTASSTR